MNRDTARALAASAILFASAISLVTVPTRNSADPTITNNPDGTSEAVWNFTNPADYTLTNTEIAGNTVTLERQPTYWWNSTTMADFSGPDLMTNVTISRWPGNVAMTASSGPQTLLTLQPGSTGEDTFLNHGHRNVNYGNSPIIILGHNLNPIIRFDLSPIPPSAVIDSATLSMYQGVGEGDPVDSYLEYVTASWNETQANWDSRLTGVFWANGGGDFGPRAIDFRSVDIALGWKSWNATQLVDLWHRGRLINYGLAIEVPKAAGGCNKTYYSSDYAINPALRPKLDIWYRVIGVAGEYVSRVGGPGSAVVWKSISWNPSVRDLSSDEFNGSILDARWTWTNQPASYDVGVTTPGSLHVLSGVKIDLNDKVFTGDVLSQGIAGDFIATMKFSANPTVNGQKSGLMVFYDTSNWYAIGKENVGGSRNWRIYATDDSKMTSRRNVASGNPVPAYVRIQRSGDTFVASASSNGVTWSLPDVYTPNFPYPQMVRVAFFVDDGGSGTALPVDVDYVRFTLPNDATVAVQTRIGDSNPVDATWSAWSPSYLSPANTSLTGTSRYIQYRFLFSVITPGHVPFVSDVNISWFRYQPAGTVETNDLIPADLSRWGNFSVVENLNGQTIAYAYSLDSGGIWTVVVPPANLSAVSVATGRIRFMASLSTADFLISPMLSELRMGYTKTLDHFYVATPPSAVVGSAFSVTVAAKDDTNATISSWTGSVNLAAYLSDGITPGAGSLGIISLSIPSGGTATLATETYTKAETIRILASSGGVTGLGGNITIIPTAVIRIVITPDNVTLLTFASRVFTAEAYDAYNNIVPGVNFTWAVGGGVGTLNATWGKVVLFTANPPAANGTLQVSHMGVSATAQIQVIIGTPPWVVIISPIPWALLTGVVPVAYINSSGAVSIQFDYYDGTGWATIGATVTLNGSYYWDTAGLDFSNGILLATVTDNATNVNVTVVSPITVDNTPPTITIVTVIDDQASNGTLLIVYATDSDVVRVDFTYFNGSWHAIGTDFILGGSFLWTPGVPINGVTVRAVAVDHVNLVGWTEKQGVGNYVVTSKPPSIAPIPDLYVKVFMTYALNLTFYVSDPDTPLASLILWDSDPANVTPNAGQYPSLYVTYSVAGTYLVTLWVSDGTDTAWTLIRIIVSPRSSPILVAPIPPVFFDEDSVAYDGFAAPASVFFNDSDGDPLSFTVLDATNILSRVNGNGTVDFWGSPHWFGSERLRLRATKPSGGWAEGAFYVIVRHVNHPPALVTPFPAVSFNENTVAMDAFGGNATSYFYDLDGDYLTISVLDGVNVSSRVNPSSTVDIWGSVNWTGSETLRVRATDPSGEFAEGVFVVTVMAVNHAPVVTIPLPTIIFDEDTAAFDVFNGPVSAHFLDREGDAMNFTVIGGVQVSARLNANLTVDLWATSHWHGQEYLLVRAMDTYGNSVDAPFLVIVRHVNHPPVLLTAFPAVTFDENEIALDVFGGDATDHFFDVDGDSLIITINGGVNVNPRVNPNWTVDLWAPTYWYGLDTLRIRASDPGGLFAEGSFFVTVRFVNQPPALAPIPDLRIDEGARLTFDIAPYISDIDTPISQIVVLTDEEHVTVNGTVLTVAYPAGRSESVFIITISDGAHTASRHVRVIFIPPWWKSLYVVFGIPLILVGAVLLTAATLIRRARWRPAKAFLLGDKRQLIREFVIDSDCEVTYGEVVKAGALDAVHGSVKVEEYYARSVKGEPLALVMLARRPITDEHIGFAREMLMNVHDKSEDAVRLRLYAKAREIEAKRKALEERSRAFAEAHKATTLALSQIAKQNDAVQTQFVELESREAHLKEETEALARETEEFNRARKAFETRRKKFEEIAIRFEKESRRRMDAIKSKGKPLEKEQPRPASRSKSSKRQ